jgi:3-oxoacyl-[acyl-carrier-protein] synthase II
MYQPTLNREEDMKRRIVVTGIGLVTPLGLGVEENWTALMRGDSGAAPITAFDARCEVKNFDPSPWIDARECKRLDRFAQFAIVAAHAAKDDSGLIFDEVEAERVGVYVGAGLGGVMTFVGTAQRVLAKGYRHGVSPYFVPAVIINIAPGYISIRLGAKGPILSQVSACSSGAHAIGEAYHCIERGDADVMIAGGTEAGISPLGISGFHAAKALSCRNEAPPQASRPFDAERDGFVMGEGAGLLVLEELTRAQGRGARIYAELIGYGLCGDAYHITAPSPGGEGAQRCMRMALQKARVNADEVCYINAHGTSTKFNDVTETQAIKTVFGARAHQISVSSTKSMTGHLLGAAGGVEAAYTALAIHRRAVPPTINHFKSDPDCDLDYVPNQPREQHISVALSNSFGFGGTNACLVFREYVGN